MTIKEIYKQYKVPLQVQSRMLLAASFIVSMREHWVGQSLDWRAIVKASLLFDIGGIVRLDFDSKNLGENIEEYDRLHWKQEQKKIIDLYGDDDKSASRKMIKKIGLDKYISTIIARGDIENVEEVAKSSDYHVKIFLYSILRVCESRNISLKEHLKILKLNYSKKQFNDYESAIYDIENTLSQDLYE